TVEKEWSGTQDPALRKKIVANAAVLVLAIASTAWSGVVANHANGEAEKAAIKHLADRGGTLAASITNASLQQPLDKIDSSLLPIVLILAAASTGPAAAIAATVLLGITVYTVGKSSSDLILVVIERHFDRNIHNMQVDALKKSLRELASHSIERTVAAINAL